MTAPNPKHVEADVRMRRFAVRTTVEEAVSWIDSVLPVFGDLATEEIPLIEAAALLEQSLADASC